MATNASEHVTAPASEGLSALWLKEDWWAIWIGLGAVVLAIALFLNDSTALKSLAVNPGGLKWVTLGQLADHFAANAGNYAVQFVVFAAVFSASSAVMGAHVGRFLIGFLFLYLLSMGMFAIGAGRSLRTRKAIPYRC